MKIAVDFDGTIVEDRYPEIGRERPFAFATLKKLIDEHHKLILWTVRKDDLLDEAVEFCKSHGVEFYAVNRDYAEETEAANRHFSRKIKADVFIDDRNVGGLPDWGQIYQIIHNHMTLEELYQEDADVYSDEREKNKKKGLFSKLFG